MHLAYPEIGILGANGINAAGLPIAVGAALSSRLQKNGRVAVAFFGDGSSNQGTFHESVNLAATLNLPVVFVCENNQFAVGTRITEATKVSDIGKRAIAYGIPGKTVDGMNVIKVYNAAKEFTRHAREGNGPNLLELKTWRFKAHFQGEPATYRSKEEEYSWLKRDPLHIARETFDKTGLLNDSEIKQIENTIQDEIDQAINFARSSPYPEPENALTDVFA